MKSDIKTYIEKQKSPQKKIIEKVRKIFLKTIPDCEEKMNWGVITFAENKFYIAALKDKVHVGFSISGLNKNEILQFEGKGKTMRHIKIKTLKDIDEKNLSMLIRLVNKKSICDTC